MAEEVIKLDDDDEASDTAIIDEGGTLKEQPKEEPKGRFGLDRKKLIIIAGAALGLVLLLVLLYFLFFKEEVVEEPKVEPGKVVRELLRQEKSQKIDANRLENMIKKANVLYGSGNKQEALNIYSAISTYSESISNFNLGVAQMTEGSFKEAIESFQKAIDSGEDRCISAINAAVSSLRIEREDLFRYYIELAQAYLPENSNLKIYPYLHSVIAYYKGNYLEMIAPLAHDTTDFYKPTKSHILAKGYLTYGDIYAAIDALENNKLPKDDLPLALMYARVGEYDLALNHLATHIESGNESEKALVAMSMISLKKGQMGDGASSLELALKKYDDNATEAYPIKVKVSDTIFDVTLAQSEYEKDFNINQKNGMKIIMYFMPYRVFDINEAFGFIQKGGVSIFINDIEEAKDVLLKGSTISRVNLNIAQAIKDALNHRIRDANTVLKNIVKNYPNHSILHYNLALSYAQMGDFNNAYIHFSRSYHLNSRDITSGILAMMCAQATDRDFSRFQDSIMEELDKFEGEPEELQFMLSLMNFFTKNYLSSLEWALKDKQDKHINHALSAVLTYLAGDRNNFKKIMDDFIKVKKGDVVVEVMKLFADYGELDIKDFALKSQEFFKRSDINKDSLYYGPSIARELYVKLGYIVGSLNYVKKDLNDKLLTEKSDPRGIMQSLAFTHIYLKNFEEAFTMYNSLIDDFKEKDTNTLFYAALSAIGSDHHENAIALLELSKLSDSSNFESRYALGLLYQEAKNFKGAAIQYSTIGNRGFVSEYFDFDVDISNTARFRDKYFK